MCVASARLCYCIQVPVVQLSVAATAFEAQRTAFLAIDLILARKRRGTLCDVASELGLRPSISDLPVDMPVDMWLMITGELVLSLWTRAEDSLIGRLHTDPATNAERCGCPVWSGIRDSGLPGVRPTVRFSYAHVAICEPCLETFFALDSVWLIKNKMAKEIESMLGYFKLAVTNDAPLSYDASVSSEFRNALPVVLPDHVIVECMNQHDGGFLHGSIDLIRALFALPPDADARFRRLFAFFPSLKPSSMPHCGDCAVQIEDKAGDEDE